MTKRYCANCDTSATHIVVKTDTPLCRSCANAYAWGQASSESEVITLKDRLIDLALLTEKETKA